MNKLKVCVANTPLILENADGTSFRVELGAKVHLAPEQYELVSAHVTVIEEVETKESFAQDEMETAEPIEDESGKPKTIRSKKV